MAKESAARKTNGQFPGTEPLKLGVLEGGKNLGLKALGREAIENQKILEEIEKEALPVAIPEKVKKYIKRTVAGGLSALAVGVGVWQYIKAGEEGRLPRVGNWDLQKGYEQIAPGVRVLFGLEEIQKETEETLNKLIEETTALETTPQATVPETTSPTTQETVPPTTEATSQTVEYEGAVFSLPKWSEGNPQTGEILALDGNPWGFEAGTKIGQCIVDAFELNREMQNSIALHPKIIESKEKESLEKDKQFRFILPFDFQKFKGIKLQEFEVDQKDYWLFNLKDLTILGKPKFIAGTIPLGTIIYEPFYGYGVIYDQGHSQYSFSFGGDSFKNKTIPELNYEGQKIHAVFVSIDAIGVKPLVPGTENGITPDKNGFRGVEFEAKVGEILAKFTQKDSLPSNFLPNTQITNPHEFSFFMAFKMVQYDFDKPYGPMSALGHFSSLDNLLKEGDNIISTMTAHD